jgi:hypothetical protein
MPFIGESGGSSWRHRRCAGRWTSAILLVAVACSSATEGRSNGDSRGASRRERLASSSTMDHVVEAGVCSSRRGVVVDVTTLRELWLRITPAPAPREMARLVAEMVEVHAENGEVGTVTAAALWASRAEASRGLPRALSTGDDRGPADGPADAPPTAGRVVDSRAVSPAADHGVRSPPDPGFEGCVEGLLRFQRRPAGRR